MTKIIGFVILVAVLIYAGAVEYKAQGALDSTSVNWQYSDSNSKYSLIAKDEKQANSQ